MWKNEHYGLGLISEINVARDEDPTEFVLSMQVWLMMIDDGAAGAAC